MKRWISFLLSIIFATIFVVSGWMLVDYLLENYREQNEFDKLAQLVEHIQQTMPTQPTEPPVQPTEPGSTVPPEQTVSTEPVPTGPILTQVTDPQTGEIVEVLPEYAQLYTMNNHLVGWMKIEGTKLNYPVMQTPNSPDYYLDKSFERTYSSSGCLYAREICDVFGPSDNVTIYGHNMKTGAMFAALHKYKKQDFYESHPYIQFDTLRERHTYRIFAIFRTTASVGQGFKYHQFIDAYDRAEFDAFVSECKRLSYYDTGVTPQYGEKLITLSTCEYSQRNGRLVVVAVRVG